jgi:hypothetical protein
VDWLDGADGAIMGDKPGIRPAGGMGVGDVMKGRDGIIAWEGMPNGNDGTDAWGGAPKGRGSVPWAWEKGMVGMEGEKAGGARGLGMLRCM